MLFVQTRLFRIASRLRDVAAPGLWLIGTMVLTLAIWRLSAAAWPLAGMTCAVTALGAVYWAVTESALRRALAQSRQDCLALQQALQRARPMETVGQMTASAAHDLNNDMTVISSNIELMLGGKDKPRHADAAFRAINRAAKTIGRLTSFARQAGWDPEPLEIDRLLAGVADTVRQGLGHRVTLRIVPPASPGFVWLDRTRMENALLSAILHGRDRTGERRTITLDVENLRLEASGLPPPVVSGDVVRFTLVEQPMAAACRWLPVSAADLSMIACFARDAGGMLLRPDGLAAGLPLRIVLPRHLPGATASGPCSADGMSIDATSADAGPGTSAPADPFLAGGDHTADSGLATSSSDRRSAFAARKPATTAATTISAPPSR